MITTYTPPANLIAMLKQDEGVRAEAYQDTKGNWTIGVGRNLNYPGLTNDETIFVLKNLEISQESINFLLLNDIERTAHQIAGLVGDLEWAQMTEARQGALISMGFMGVKSLESFHNMFKAINVGDWENAAEEALNSKWATDVGPHRSQRLANMLRTGEWEGGEDSNNKENPDTGVSQGAGS